MSALFEHFDQDRLDDVAGRLVTALIAVIEFATTRPEAPEDPANFMEAVVTKALLMSLAATFVVPHTDQEQDEALIAGAADFLRKAVAELRADS